MEFMLLIICIDRGGDNRFPDGREDFTKIAQPPVGQRLFSAEVDVREAPGHRLSHAMCTRFALLQKDYHAVLARLGVAAPAAYASRYNLPPSQRVPAVRIGPASHARELADLRWGLTPGWARADTPDARHANARAETLTAKPAFRDAFRLRRCVVPASGFYEWAVQGRNRLPWFFQRRDGRPFCFAALWEAWTPPGGDTVESCALVTTAPNAEMRPIHHRMPLVLDAAQSEAWLDPARPAAQLATLLHPPADGLLTAVRVSRRMNNVRHEGPDCIVPCAEDEPGGEPELPLEIN